MEQDLGFPEVRVRRVHDASHLPKKLSVCLITSLAIADFVDPELTAEGTKRVMPGNVGILTLVAELRERGYEPDVVNLDRLFLEFRREWVADTPSPAGAANNTECQDRPEHLFSFVVQRLQSLHHDVFGFSTICSSYPLTLRLAEQVKRLNPNAHVVLGGPQASVVDVSTLEAFDFVDFVVRGEADRTFPALLDVLSGVDRTTKLEDISGITFRRHGEVVRNPNAAVVQDLDTLPMPAFDLDEDIRDRGSVYLEIGRGCPFACTFCSTNDFFRRRFRLKSVERTMQDLARIRKAHGISSFSFIHDMYTVDRRRVVEFCEALLASGESVTWACSARTDCVDDELIELMARAGCRGIFFGIETGSDRLQKVIKKRLDLAQSKKRIECADRHGITTAVALITAFPDERREDLRETIHFFLDALRLDHAEPQLSLLAPLGATPVYEEHKNELVLDNIFSDISHQGWDEDPADLALITSHPEVFSNFYAVPTRWLPRSYFKGIRDLVSYLALRFRWLPVALLQDSEDFLTVFDRWMAWSEDRRSMQVQPEPDLGSSPVPYYCGREFVDDFLEFTATCYVPEMARHAEAIATLVRTEAAAQSLPAESASPDRHPLEDATVPHVTEHVQVLQLGLDYGELIRALRLRADLDKVPARAVTAVLQRVNGRIRMSELSPLSAALVDLCDGQRRVQDVVREFAALSEGLLEPCQVPEVTPEQACLFGLATLHEQGVLAFRAEPLPRTGGTATRDGKRTSLAEYLPPPERSNTQRPWPWPHADATADAC